MTQERVGAVVGNNLMRMRTETGQSQSDIARRLTAHGLTWTRDQVSLLENGKRDSVALEELLVMSWTFAVPLSYWFDGDGDIQVTSARLPEARSIVRDSLRGKVVKDGFLIEVDFSDVQDYSVDDSIARKLDVAQQSVIDCATTLWGHSATAERDKRLGPSNGRTPKELRTARGGMTKRLTREIDAELSDAQRSTTYDRE